VPSINSFDKTKIYYEHSKKGKETLIFIHGWGHNHTVWNKETNFFSSKYSTLTLDIRGHGESGKPEEISSYKLENFARDIEEIIKKNKIKQPILIGHSLGGMITLKFIEIFPKTAKAIILIDATHKNPLEGRYSQTTSKLTEKVIEFIFKHKHIQKKHFKNVDFSKFKKHSDIYYWLKGLEVTPTKSLLACLKEMLEFDETKILHKIKIPTLIIWGDKDTIIPLNQIKEMNKDIKESKLVIIKKGTHDTNITNSEKINEEINYFLNNLK